MEENEGKEEEEKRLDKEALCERLISGTIAIQKQTMCLQLKIRTCRNY